MVVDGIHALLLYRELQISSMIKVVCHNVYTGHVDDIYTIAWSLDPINHMHQYQIATMYVCSNAHD